MPMGADPLPASQIKLIRAWIDQNAFAIPAVPATPPAVPVAAHPQELENGSGIFAAGYVRYSPCAATNVMDPTFSKTACDWIRSRPF